MSFVIGEDNTNFLKTRYEALKPHTLFRSMEYSEDHAQIAKWAPLIVKGRDPKQRIAATRAAEGTDVDFGALTRELTTYLGNNGVEINYGHDVTGISKASDGGWDLSLKHPKSGEHGKIHAKFVFVGAGGGALHLLQASGIPESKGYGGFPVSGQFFRCTDETLAAQHSAKVYGQASVGAPPMSVPHLDTRYVNGKRSLLFGPYAGFSTNFLKNGSYLDLPLSIRPSNIIPMLAVAKDNMDLTAYLVKEVAKRHGDKVEALREYYPEAKDGDWELITAGQRVQIIKKDPKKGGVLQFGTEVIAGRDGSIGALLGASPGASTAVPIMIELLQKSFPKNFKGWQSQAQGHDARLRRQARREPGPGCRAGGGNCQGTPAGERSRQPLTPCRRASGGHAPVLEVRQPHRRPCDVPAGTTFTGKPGPDRADHRLRVGVRRDHHVLAEAGTHPLHRVPADHGADSPCPAPPRRWWTSR